MNLAVWAECTEMTEILVGMCGRLYDNRATASCVRRAVEAAVGADQRAV
jgi:predicted site-specific integrase-resolvase